MVHHTQSAIAWRPLVRRTAVVIPALSAVTLAVAPSAGAQPLDGGAGSPVAEKMPTAQAFDGTRQLPSVSEVTRLCGQTDRHACSFTIDPARSREYTSVVHSVANGAINCTSEPMNVKRTVTLQSISTDNIGGEISGSGTIEGTAGTDNEVSGSGTGQVTAQQTLQESDRGSETEGTTNKTGTTNHSNLKDKGPTQDVTSESTTSISDTVDHTVTDTTQTTEMGSTTVAAKSNIHLALRGAFTAAFRGIWNHTWSMVNTETTEVQFTIKANDELQFGALNAMTRTVGDLVVDGTGKLVKNVTVDGPSTVNSSTIVAQTFTNPDRCQTLRPPGASARQPDDEPRNVRRSAVPGAEPARPTARYALRADGTWRPIG
ncbi:hypothetical protein [Streptomyces clavuligerus]|nr:hypothetical protein [Streptomyces clavuligerus]WDN54969.1 hypothetical protein LL058_25740 [Streptomyces clavuligerus]